MPDHGGEVKLVDPAEERIIGSLVGFAPWGMYFEHPCAQAGVELMVQAFCRWPRLPDPGLGRNGVGIAFLPRVVLATLHEDVIVRSMTTPQSEADDAT